MQIEIQSRHSLFASQVAAQLEERGFSDTTVRHGAPEAMCIRYNPAADATSLHALVQALQPHQLALSPDEGLVGTDTEAVVELGSPTPLDEVGVRIITDSEALGAEVRMRLEAEGFCIEQVFTVAQVVPGLAHHEADGLAIGVAAACLAEYGIQASEHKWEGDEAHITVRVPDPALAELLPRKRFIVRICSDHPEAAEQLAGELRDAHFKRVITHIWSEDDEPSARISVAAGPFVDELDKGRLFVCTQRVCEERGVDFARYPIQSTAAEGSHGSAVIHLPIGGCISKVKRPYAGVAPERFDLRIVTNGDPAPEHLQSLLARRGFSRAIVDTDGSGEEGFAIHFGRDAKEPRVARLVVEAVRSAMRSVGAAPQFPLNTSDYEEGDSATIVIYFPTQGIDDGSLLRKFVSPGRFRLILKSEDSSHLEPLAEELCTWGWGGFETTSASVPEHPVIHYGGAPRQLLERLCQWIQLRTGLHMATKKEWPEQDPDVWVHLPTRALARLRLQEQDADDPAFEVGGTLEDWLAPQGDSREPILSVVSRGDGVVRIVDTQLPVREGEPCGLVPTATAFEEYCLDTQTAAAVRHVAASVVLREPCLLEGETSTSKTSSVLYVAHLANQPTVRVNLSGQTDTGELIGRYVPAVGVDDPSSKTGDFGRGGWRWQDGLVVQAMREGWWLLLDEINLAEPQVLERLNSVLEQQPSLVLTEHDNAVLGAGGEPVHEDFRLFATMNPAEYAGRSILSPAYRNRWRAHLIVPRPGEGEYHQMLQQLVFGRQPVVKLNGRTYESGSAAAPAAKLALMPDVDRFLLGLARFHASLQAMTGLDGGVGGFGGSRKERYVFTRRDLLSIMHYIVSGEFSQSASVPTECIRGALMRYYVSRVSPGEDRDAVVNLLDAAGIGPGTWMLRTSRTPARRGA